RLPSRRSRDRPRRGCRLRRPAASSTPRRAPPRPPGKRSRGRRFSRARSRPPASTVHGSLGSTSVSLFVRPRALSRRGRGGEPAPLEIDHRNETGVLHFVEREAQDLFFAGRLRGRGRRARGGGTCLRGPAPPPRAGAPRGGAERARRV